MNTSSGQQKYVKPRLLFIGDSITVGDGDEEACGWPSRLCRASGLTKSPIHCYNLGVGGDKITDIAARWQFEANARLAGKAGGALIFMMGLNDALKAAAKEGTIPLDLPKLSALLKTMLTQALDFGPTLLVEPTPVHKALQRSDGGSGESVNQHLHQVCELLSEAAVAAGVPRVPLTETLSRDVPFQHALAAGDHLHPAAAGQERICKHLLASDEWSRFLTRLG